MLYSLPPSGLIEEETLLRCSILVVDDVEMNRKLLEHSLMAQGFSNILTAADGAEALQITRTMNPDMVILDLMMPAMDGFSYCQAVRQDATFNQMPILVQTVLEDADKKVQAFKLGATDYICKPISPDELAARTRVHLTHKILVEELSKYRHQMQEEMHTALLMQQRIMPNAAYIQMCERVFNMSIANHFENSSTLGGDYWNVLPLSSTRMAIYMLDFSGHGISAAMNVFRIHTIMQECAHANGDPAQYLSAINRHLYPLLERHEFATMFYGVIDIEANCLLYATAAMHPVLLYSAIEKRIIPINGRGFALGAAANAVYETQFIPFMSGDMLLLYSDCLTETPDKQEAYLSEGKICLSVEKLIAKSKAPQAHAIVNHLYDMLKQHSSAPLNDDLTICSYWRK